MKTETDGPAIERRVRKALEAFDRTETLPPDPSFYGRVMARLAAGRSPKGVWVGVLRPALLVALVVLNLATAFWYLGGGRRSASRPRTAFAQALASDLNLTGEPASFLALDRE